MKVVRRILFFAFTLVCAGCNKAPSTAQAPLPFEYTNIVHQSAPGAKQSNTETVITFTNDVWFEYQSEKISLGLGTNDYNATVYFEQTNHAVRRIIQTVTVGTNHLTLMDRDGDGIPDERRDSQTKQSEILLRGDWRPVRGPWTNRETLVNSNWIPVHFENGRWSIQSTNKATK